MKTIVILAIISMAAAASINKENLEELSKGNIEELSEGNLEELIKDVVEDVIEYFTTKDDNLDMEAVVADDAELLSHVKCYMDLGPCTDVTSSYKDNIPEAVRTACKRCNVAQKHLVNIFFEGLKRKMPEEYQKLRNMYDPENKYFDDLEKAIAGY